MRTNKRAKKGLTAVLATVVAAPALLSNAVGQETDPGADQRAYYVYVAAESEDRVDLIRFEAGVASVIDTIHVGRNPTEIDGPHGLAVDPSGERWYVTLAHGNPYGAVVAYSTETNRPLGSTELGFFPASLHVTPAGLLFAANFNLHGEHVASSVSVVDVGSMTEIAQVATCTMPHGSRLTSDGSRHYSACMMDDRVVELDAYRLEVRRQFSVTPGEERPFLATGPANGAAEHHATPDGPPCSPTWAHPSPDGRRVYVACNKRAEVLELDVDTWQISRRFKTAEGPYNLDVSPDGARLVVTYKSSQSTGVWDLVTGEELARVENTRRLPHGIAISSDARYAFISVEGVGAEPGAVDVIDLERGKKVTSVDVGKQAGGIAFWRIEAS